MAGTVTTAPWSAEARSLEAKRLYRRITGRKYLILAGFAVVLLASIALDISSGPAGLPLAVVLRGVFAPATVDPSVQVILWDIRMPMALMAVVVGASLSVAGAEMQTILNNPLASPFTLGISAAAGFGAAMALVLGISVIPFAGVFLVSANAFVFALLASLFIYFFSRARGVSSETMVLLGIALVFMFNALLALMEYLASDTALQQVVFWSMGSLTKSSWPKIGIGAVVLLATIPYFMNQVWRLTALRLGDEKARSLGVNVERLRLNVLIAVSLLAATSVAFVGTIGFVGLVGPHVARMLVGEDQRYFLPTSALAGALLLSVTSILSKSILPGVLIPIGIITSLIGVPFFLSLIMLRRRQLW
ncbi:MAG: iron ABC transporter permease [Chloroflexi bacterium]|nr:iron ABC transporter permease [Chloroflexota bacterium]